MGQYVIKMPDIGEGIAEVELVAWRVKPGDAVGEDEILADVMTDKATVEIPSPVAGTVLELGCQPGALMAVGAELIRLEVEGAGNATANSVIPAAEGSVPPQPEKQAEAATVPRPIVSAERVAGSMTTAPMHSSLVATSSSTHPLGAKPFASPAVRQRAWDLGIELQFVRASGPAGRVTHDDLDMYVASAGQASHASAANGYVRRHGEEAVPVIGLRRKIAQKMQEAKRRIPHFSYVEEVDVTELEALRSQLNGRYGDTRGKLTILPLLIRALVLALQEFPQMNARFDDDAGVVTRYEPVHLGMATQTESGLVVPAIRHTEALDPWSCAREIARLADACRIGKASREELSGSTITVSSLGPLGGIVTTPVINYPEVAIVGVNRIVERPVFRGGAIVARKMMNLSSSFDHRVIDGMDAALFIQSVRALLESPALLFVE